MEIIIERNTKTNVYNLQIGDRFYKVNDKKKEVWEKVESEFKQPSFQKYKHFAKRDGDKYPVELKPTLEVIFLRHKI